MQKNTKFREKSRQKDIFITVVRQKLGISQPLLAALLGVSRPLLALAEANKRNLPSEAGHLLAKMYLQFMELEKGIQANYRSLETRLLLNDCYRREIPVMVAREKECRLKLKRLSEELLVMRQREKNAEHAIIVYTTLLGDLGEKASTDVATARQLKGLKVFKQGAYQQLTGCWAPEQVTLQAKIGALRAEARVLRSTRLKIMREHHPFKK